MRQARITHLVVEGFGVPRNITNSDREVRERLHKFAMAIGTEVWQSFSYAFHLGVSAVVIVTQSHISVHTWPEFRYIHLDVLTCSSELDETMVATAAEKQFRPKAVKVTRLSY